MAPGQVEIGSARAPGVATVPAHNLARALARRLVAGYGQARDGGYPTPAPRAPRPAAPAPAAGNPAQRPRPGARGLARHTLVATASKAEFGVGCGGVRDLALAAGSMVAVAPLRLKAEAAAPVRPMATTPACLSYGYSCGTRSPGHRTAASCLH